MALTPGQVRFRARYLVHGDPTRAYVEAGFKGNPKHGVKYLMSLPYMIEAKDELAKMASDRIAALARIDLAPVHRLEVKQNRIAHLAAIASGDAEMSEDHVHPITGEVVTVTVKPSFKDQIAAAKLLGLMFADFLVKKEVEHKGVGGAIFVHSDNGRGPTPGKVLAQDFTVCEACSTAYDSTEAHQCEKRLSAENKA